MSTVAWITALTIGAFAVVIQNNSAHAEPTIVEMKAAPVVEVDPLEKYKDAKSITGKDLKEFLSLIGFEGKALKTAWAVVMRESRGNTGSHNTNANTGDNSYGLFQINMIGSLGEDRLAKFQDRIGIVKKADLFNPIANARAAYYMTAKGSNWASWGLGPDAYDGSPDEHAVTVWFTDYPQ